MKLADYLIKENITITEFAVLTGISTNALYMYRRGYKASKPYAKIINAATKGEVTLEDLKGKK